MEQHTHNLFSFPYEHTLLNTSDSIARSGLEAYFDASLHRPLMLITGPAGSGKTTAVQNWIRQRADIASCWLALEELHNDVEYFWRELTQTCNQLQHQSISFHLSNSADKTLLHPTFDQQTTPQSLLSVLAAERQQDIVIILDNYQAIEAKAIQHMIISLVEHAPPHLHLVLISRIDPPLPLARLHVQGKLVEIDAEHLRFGKDEIALLCLHSLGRVVRRDIIEDLYQHTEGWAAGLKLALLAMQTKTSQASMKAYVRSLSGSNRYVARYLEEEVFAPLPPDTQQFLLFTSLLKHMDSSLCDAITEREDSFSMLASLQHHHLFIHMLENGWYRYDRFFAELLQARLYQLHPQIIDTIHLRAQLWYEQHAMYEDGLKHRLAITKREMQHEKNTINNVLTNILSDRELMVLNLIAQGLSNQEVAHTLVVSISTVKTHLNSIYEKMHVHTRLQAVNRGYELELLTTQTPAERAIRTYRIEIKDENG